MKKKNQAEDIKEQETELLAKDGSASDGDGQAELSSDPPKDDQDQENSLEEQLEMAQKSLDEITAKADEYLDGWQRARAEFANYKKRILREHTDNRQIARGEAIKLFLDIADDLERALQDKPQQGEGETWAGGIEIIHNKLRTRLEAEGIKPMNALGEEFDPNIHEALMKEESDEYESGQIIEVMQEGYWIGEKVLRPALVRVAA